MSQFKVTASSLRSAADILEKQRTVFADATNAIQISVLLLRAQWEGDAADAFQTEQENQIKWFREMINAVSSVETALRTIANRYQDTDHDAARKLRSSR